MIDPTSLKSAMVGGVVTVIIGSATMVSTAYQDVQNLKVKQEYNESTFSKIDKKLDNITNILITERGQIN